MSGSPDARSRRLAQGGFANAEIPAGFERSRSAHLDAPMSRRGAYLFYGLIAALLVGGAVLIWVSASA